MPFDILWSDAAFDAMDVLDDRNDRVTAAVREVLSRLEDDPFDPKLGTRTFVTPRYGHARLTPCRGTRGWMVVWALGQDVKTIEIVMVAELELP